jgi:hypothetical protein
MNRNNISILDPFLTRYVISAHGLGHRLYHLISLHCIGVYKGWTEGVLLIFFFATDWFTVKARDSFSRDIT